MPSRERSFRAEAVILRHSDWGEADRMLWLYSRQHGKLRAIGKGLRKLRSRKAGHLEPFTHVSLQLARGRDMLIVTQAETIDAYLPLREDLVRLGYAAYTVELLDRFTYEEDDNPALYRLLVDTLARLNSEPDPQLAVRYYELRLLDLLGYRPQLFHCASCENEIRPEDQYFSAAQGGALCPNCGLQASEARPISMQALKYLRHFQRSSYAEASRAHPAPELQRQLEALMQYYLTYLLERGLNTPAFIREVRREWQVKGGSE
jgi:DNA repair protein RecO (recombination protein O)